jgi:hypothetical protein
MVAALIALAFATSPPVTHDTVPVYVTPSNRGVDSYEYSWSAGSRVQTISLGVFRRPRRMQDVAPPFAQTLARYTGGKLAQSRLLLVSGRTRIYAFPTEKRGICFVRTPPGGSSCVMSLVHGAYPQVDPRRDVWGILDDGAVRVDVTVGRRVLRAHLGRNAFFLALPFGTVVPSRIVVHERDRVRHVYEIERCTSPASC